MSSSEEDEFPLIKFGTPLEEPDDEETVKKPIAVHEQIVTDSEGRRRFHGAFTGGFSAGYYNTVNTKDGWAPSTFRSSRSDRTKNKVLAPEDFMDEEDMSEFGIAPKKIVTQSSFSSNKQGERQPGIRDKFPKNATMLLGFDMLQTLIIPVSNNIGIKLLQKMGWKPGQGIGPKVKRRRLKKDDYIPENVTFSPEDTVPMDFTAKDNVHGLGYSGMDPKLALHDKFKKSSAISIRTKTGAKLSFAGQAFGVGAYEDEDQDIYAQDSMANYDLVMGEEKQDDAYGWSRPTKAITGLKAAEAITFVRKVLEGFKKAEISVRRKVYPPPLLPYDFDPNKRLKLQQESRRLRGLSQNKGMEQFLQGNEKSKFERLNPDQRRDLLEDGKLKPLSAPDPANIKSVFDLISPRDRERLERFKLKKNPIENKELQLKKTGFYEPFSSDSAKQARYKQYLELLKEKKIDPYSHIDHDPHMTEWEKQQEQEEFTKSSRFFQPLSATMSSRFRPESAAMREQDEKEQALKKAAKMKMFGMMTREAVEWHPDPLLCKRFNVPDPYPHSEVVGVPGLNEEKAELFLHPNDFKRKPSKPPEQKCIQDKNSEELQPNVGKILKDTRHPSTSGAVRNSKSRWDEEPALQGPATRAETVQEEDNVASDADNMEQEPVEEDGSEQVTERPAMALFKAIFENSDEDSSSEEDDDDVAPAEAQGFDITAISTSLIPETNQPSDKESKILIQTDFSAVNQPRYHKFRLKSNGNETKTLQSGADDPPTPESDKVNDEAELFGPALPPPSKLSKLWKTTDPESLIGGCKKVKKKKQKKQKRKDRKKSKKHSS